MGNSKARRLTRLEASYGDSLTAPAHYMLGLNALFKEMAGHGVCVETLLAGTGLSPEVLLDAHALISHQQKLNIFANVAAHTPDPAVALRAGQKLRLSDFGIFGYALICCRTLGEAVEFGIRHIRLAGPVLEKGFRIEDDLAIFEGRNYLDLGSVLSVASEYWFSSTLSLIDLVIESPFIARGLYLPYPAPAHAPVYRERFQCPVHFDSGRMEWHFDASLLSLALPNANPLTADTCAEFCQKLIDELDSGGSSDLIRAIHRLCLESPGHFPAADAAAASLRLSRRTLHRRLAQAGTSYQQLLDGIREQLAVEFLESTPLSIEEIAARIGFSDASNFRKAFKRWTGQQPTHFRNVV